VVGTVPKISAEALDMIFALDATTLANHIHLRTLAHPKRFHEFTFTKANVQIVLHLDDLVLKGQFLARRNGSYMSIRVKIQLLQRYLPLIRPPTGSIADVIN